MGFYQLAALMLVMSMFYNGAAQTNRLVCYWGSWSIYREGLGAFDTADIDPFMCTHLIYGFAGIDNSTFKVKSLDPWCDLTQAEGGFHGNYQKANDLKLVNPDLKVLIGVGGWTAGSEAYSDMASTSANRQAFIEGIVDFLDRYGFDGMELDWEYPTERGGVPEDKQNFVQLLREINYVFNVLPTRPIISVAVAAGKDTIDHAYDVPEVANNVEFLNIMAYDYRLWVTTNVVGVHNPLYSKPGENATEALKNANFSVNYYLQLGAPPQKLNLGMPAYAHTFTLAIAGEHAVNVAGSIGPGSAGRYTKENGTLSYYEVCEKINALGFAVEFDTDYRVPFAYSPTEWISYENTVSIIEKVQLAKSLNLGGVMFYEYAFDACTYLCVDEPQCPLLTAIKANLSPPPGK